MSTICGIYKITSPSNRIYIGQAIDIDRRKNRYRSKDCKNQVLLFKSILKYGWEAHNFEVVEELQVKDLNCRERYWQDFYDVLNGGLNCVLQECKEYDRIFSEETLKRMRNRKSLSGVNHPNYGKIGKLSSTYGRKHTKEAKDKMSATRKGKYIGERNKRYGTKLSEEVKQKIRNSQRDMRGINNPNYGKSMSEEQKLKISNTRKEKV